jgi:hypothetical protein
MTLLVALWFHTRPEELECTLSPETAQEELRAIFASPSSGSIVIQLD